MDVVAQIHAMHICPYIYIYIYVIICIYTYIYIYIYIFSIDCEHVQMH